MTDRDERVSEYASSLYTDELAEMIVDLEDALAYQKGQNKILAKGFMDMKLDPSRLESALRMYVAELNYDIHKDIQCGEEDGLDRYPEEVDFFLRCWETAGEG